MTETERIVNEVVAELAAKGISLDQVRQIIRTPEETAEEAGEERTKVGNTPTCEECGESLDHCTCE